jgi:hypothetical protein
VVHAGPTVGVKNLFVPVPNYHPPTVAQMDMIATAVVQEVRAGGVVMEHCGGGKGRWGLTLLDELFCWCFLSCAFMCTKKCSFNRPTTADARVVDGTTPSISTQSFRRIPPLDDDLSSSLGNGV